MSADVEYTNAERANRAGAALAAYHLEYYGEPMSARSEEPYSLVQDLLTDLLHYLQENVKPNPLVERSGIVENGAQDIMAAAYRNYEAETDGLPQEEGEL